MIELMIVVAIIGLLASIALPAYQTYTVRSKLSEVILAASACRATVSASAKRFCAMSGQMPVWAGGCADHGPGRGC